MTGAWQTDRTPITESPYIYWWRKKDPSGRLKGLAQIPKPEDRARAGDFSFLEAFFDYDRVLPIPEPVVADDIGKVPVFDPSAVTDELPKDLAADTVIVGIIDSGIALGQRRFRTKDGKTRVLASWQQAAEHVGQAQSYLPFGREVFQNEIQSALHCCETATGLDEDAFNRRLGLVQPDYLHGHRDLDFAVSHGTHVLDLASGYDPCHTDARTMERFRILAVNLPPQSMHGSAGNFLAFWALCAVQRIISLADAISSVNKEAPDEGFPIVLNFSYGMHAGPKNGKSIFEQKLRKIMRERAKSSDLRVVMPTGNANQDRGAARQYLGADGKAQRTQGAKLASSSSLPWRIMPSDTTSNFVEIWINHAERDHVLEQSDSEDFTLWVTPPTATEPLQVPALEEGQFAVLGDYAAVFRPSQTCEHDKVSSGMLHFLIAVAPTASWTPKMALAPAGCWDIRLEYRTSDPKTDGTKPVNACFYIQSDQSGARQSNTGLQSYFDHKKYSRLRGDDFDTATSVNGRKGKDAFAAEKGRLIAGFLERDSYGLYDNEEPWDFFGPVQRKGTLNALASTSGVVTIGGYRRSDYRPALYSGTVDGRNRSADDPKKFIAGLFPSDDAPDHLGILGAGSKDGSVIPFQGTSMAAGLATRMIAEAFDGPGGTGHSKTDVDTDTRDLVKPAGHVANPFDKVSKLKRGQGHFPMPKSREAGRVRRIDPQDT